MRWTHPHALVIDPDADEPRIIGARFKRREPAGDDFDLVEVAGLHDNGPDNGGVELVIRCVAFTGNIGDEPSPVVTADADSLLEAYARVDDDEMGGVAERLDARLRALEARLG